MTKPVSIIGVPYDEQSSFRKGCAEGPQAIREAYRCDSSNTFCEDGFDIETVASITDCGDLEITSGVEARETIERAVGDLVKKDQRVLTLGGDHAITWPILRGIRSVHSSLSVLHLDAHPDLYDQLEGNRYSHATPMARSLEENLIDRLVQVGIRTMNAHQQQQADRFNVEVVSMRNWQDGRKFEFDGPVYLSLDLDVLDPAFVPGVSHHEPGGFNTRQVIDIIQNLDADLIGADIVELNPSRDRDSVTAMTAAKLMKEILARMIR